MAEELLWFIKGSTDARELQAKHIHIWDGNSSKDFLTSIGQGHRCWARSALRILDRFRICRSACVPFPASSHRWFTSSSSRPTCSVREGGEC